MLASWTTPTQRRLFDSMHVADQRHGLDVVASLRAEGVKDRDVLLAGLLHDAGKADTGVWPRVTYSLGQAYGTRVWSVASVWPGMGRSLDAAARARRAIGGAGDRGGMFAADGRADPAPGRAADLEFGELLRLADEAN